MKRILITGANSYIGTSVENWLTKGHEKYNVDTIGTRDGLWKEKDFSEFDVVFHVAGIAHIKETHENTALYFKVNRDLAYEIAQKAKDQRIKQFIFLSSMSVFGIENGVIGKDTLLNPISNYGRSKLEAEKLIESLETDNFKIAILRPPMIYGKGCKGNYPRMAKFAIKSPLFPDIENKRSMIYIDNLCEFVKVLIDNYSTGIFFPQNEEYVCTSDMVKMIAEIHGKRLRMTKLFNPLLKILNINMVNKVFGDLVYNKNLSTFPGNKTIFLKESINKTEM